MDNGRIDFNLNGQPVSLEPKSGEMLSDVLRVRLNLTGTKIGCNEAECGICTVLVNGESTLSCSFPAQRANGKEVITIEGLSKLAQNGRKLHPLQEAFVLYGAVQCGFCIPGQILTAYGLLLKNPEPTSSEIRHALRDTLCRCAGYPTIEKSILAAAKSMRTSQPVEPPDVAISSRPQRVIGRLHKRPEAEAKTTGDAKYTDDIKFEGMLHGMAKRAGTPHAIVKEIRTEKARLLPGVRAVLTADDIPGEHYHGLVIYDWPVLVGPGERVRFVGDAVALVAADTRDIAVHALDLIEVTYNLLPVITNPVQANLPETASIHKSGNLLKHIKVRKGDVEEGFAESDIVLEHTFFTPTTEQAYIEPECSIARITPEKRMEIFVGSQIPYSDRSQVARVIDWPEERVHIIGMLIGGGFGGKEDIAGQIHAALLTLKTGQSVKVLYDRHESMLVHPKRHATQIRVKMGARQDGSLVSVLTELYGDTGAYASLGEKVMTRATTHSSGPYEIPNVKADCYAMYTNNPPAGAFRGFGVTQSSFAIESMVDRMAETLKMDPVEFRKKNALKVGSITNTGQLLKESVGLCECIEKVDKELRLAAGENPFSSKIVSGAYNKRTAWGFAAAYKNTGLGGGAEDKAGAEVEVYDDGSVEVRTSSAEIGQGLVTVLQMIVAEEMEIPIEKVKVLLSDTDLTPDGGPTTASRQTYVTGNAARMAAKAIREALATTVAEKFDCPPEKVRFIEGLAQVDGQSISIGDIAKEMKIEGRQPRALYEYIAPATQHLGEGGDMHFAFSFAAQAAGVEVDVQTGEVKVLRIITATDVGTAINPLGLQGQIEGGIMMGLGNALTENYIVENGMVVTDRLARYRMPSIVHTPEITSIIVEHPTQDGPFGAKGVGEISSIPTTPAITNAIYNAVGIRIDHLPVDQELIAMELSSKEIILSK
ncbi:MAG: molybdopterin-dependent oxidoreductase [Anaerolineaceae bacterium]|nr:molybdopterin-dependent oxidoreductase [Anaerolineaceae bacterium]